MTKEKNPVWAFFASVKLALFLLIILAVTSVIGTLIPQGQEPGVYVREYGPGLARVFQLLQFDQMYGSWWFVGLLGLFSMNLIVCSLDRIPNVWRLVVQDNLDTDEAKLARSTHHWSQSRSTGVMATAAAVQEAMTAAGWRPQQEGAAGGDGRLFFAQKGRMTRLGVYVVHSSILIIFVGAIIGSLLGYKASVLIAEGAYSDRVFKSSGDNAAVPLGFQVHLDKFTLDLYPTGAPKEFRSDLIVIEDGQEKLRKSIVVNDPLDYGGLTFYQASYQGLPEYRMQLVNTRTGAQKSLDLEPRQQESWAEEGVVVGLLNTAGSGPTTSNLKIWFSDGQGEPQTFWLSQGGPRLLATAKGSYQISYVRQRFATGLQVAKDPGVWYVYTGCILMLVGIYVAFFMSHRRVWVLVRPEGDGSWILAAGNANKNRIGFERDFDTLVAHLSGQDQGGPAAANPDHEA
ncbi:MAG: cytochrome c biogenesis protein ResB [Thermodesulfobacteriota bacterium]